MPDTINFTEYDKLNAKEAHVFLDGLEDAGQLVAYVEHERAREHPRSTVLTDEILDRLPAAEDDDAPAERSDKAADSNDHDAKGDTYANGVFVPDGVEPGKSPGWPLYETEGGDWLPLDLTDEQREGLVEDFADSTVESVILVNVGDVDRHIVLDDQGDYVAVPYDPDADQKDEGGTGTDERHGIDVPADGVATTLSEDGAARTITRENDSAWWCPFCDTSMLHGIVRCPGCGSVREDDLAVKR